MLINVEKALMVFFLVCGKHHAYLFIYLLLASFRFTKPGCSCFCNNKESSSMRIETFAKKINVIHLLILSAQHIIKNLLKVHT